MCGSTDHRILEADHPAEENKRGNEYLNESRSVTIKLIYMANQRSSANLMGVRVCAYACAPSCRNMMHCIWNLLWRCHGNARHADRLPLRTQTHTYALIHTHSGNERLGDWQHARTVCTHPSPTVRWNILNTHRHTHTLWEARTALYGGWSVCTCQSS